MGDGGFHGGETAVQERAGVQQLARRLSGMLAPPDLRGGAATFLAHRRLAVLTATDERDRLWTSPLTGPAGFLRVTGADRLDVDAVPGADDPLAGLPEGQRVGLVAIEPALRRRLRVNGVLSRVGSGSLQLGVDQAFGNCPQYIWPRQLTYDDPPSGPAGATAVARVMTAPLDEEARAAVTTSDTFFLGTRHHARGADSSHRGGPAGFVRVAADGRTLTWADYPGNNMFTSLGNLQVDDVASLLFVDFASGRSWHLSGTARVEWDTSKDGLVDGGTGRRVQFEMQRWVTSESGIHSS